MNSETNKKLYQNEEIDPLKRKLSELGELVHRKDEFEDRINEIKTNLRRIEHTLRLGFWKYNIQRQTVFCSAGMMKFLGMEPFEQCWNFAEFQQMIHPVDRDSWTREIYNAIHEKRFHELEFRIQGLDGTVRHLREEGELQTDSYGHPVCFFFIVHSLDTPPPTINNTNILEPNLERANHLLSSSRENSALAIMEWDKKFRLKQWSKSAEELFGWEEKEVVNRPWDELELFHEKDHALIQHMADGFCHGEKQHEVMSLPTKTKAGSYLQCEWYFSVFHWENGESTILSQVQDITERKKAEIDVHFNEERYRTLFEQSSLGIFESTPEGKILRANQACAQLFGYDSPMEAIRSIQDIAKSLYVNPEIRAEIIQEVLETKKMIEREVLLLKKDGTPFNALLRVQAIQDEAKPFPYLLGFVEDISERKKAEYALIESEERFRTIFERSSLGIYETSPEGRFYRANEAFARMFGYDSPQDVLDSVYDIPSQVYRYPEDRAFIVQQVLNMQGVLETELDFKRKDGSTFTGSIRMQAVHDARGGHTYLFGFVEDVTERKRAEEELRNSKQLLQSVLDSTPALIFIKDQQGRFVLVNQLFVEFANRPRHQIVGHTDDEVFPQFDMTEIRENDQKVFQSNSLMVFEETVESEDTEKIFLSTKVPLENVGFQERVLLGVSTDITERKRSEEERIKLESQLQQSQKMEAVGRLAGGVAHNINNLLTGIIGNLNLADSEASNKSKRYIQEALKAAEKSSTLVQQLLAFSRKSFISPKPLDLNVILDEVYLLVRPSVERWIDIDIDKETSLPLVYADHAQMTTVFMNLCINARDAIDELLKSTLLQYRDDDSRFSIQMKSERCKVSSEACENHTEAYAGDFVRVSVSDNGIGMKEETVKHIFEPFFTTKDVGKGTGLGLASSFGIIKQHEGWIDIQTQFGKGTTFMIYLPVTSETRQESDFSQQSEMEPGNETLLFVDDERMIRNLAKTILERKGYEVFIAKDGEEGWKIFLQQKDAIDLVVLDLSMPKLSGLEVSKKIKEMDPTVKILFSSGYQEVDVLGEEIEGTDLITKPYRPAILMEKIRALLDS